MQFAVALFLPFPRLLTESKQAEFTQKARILIQLEKYDDAVSIRQNRKLYIVQLNLH